MLRWLPRCLGHCRLVGGKFSATYIVCKTWDDGNPDLISTHWQMGIGSDEEMVKQTHVGHGLQWSGTAEAAGMNA
jgi:hypothetical protein